jgi:hypothetical protein
MSLSKGITEEVTSHCIKFPPIIGEKYTRAKNLGPPASTAPLRKIPHKNFGLVLSSIFAMLSPRALTSH